MKRTDEYIICSAIWYKDLPDSYHKPVNIDKGIVVCGMQHHICIDVFCALTGKRSVESEVGENIQGFMTNKRRFVDRLEALEIAKKAEQVNENELGNPRIGLFSEDIF